MPIIKVKFFRRELKFEMDATILQTDEKNIQIKNLFEKNKNLLIEIKHQEMITFLDFSGSRDIKVLFLNNHNVIVGETSILDDFGELKTITENKRILLVPLEDYIRLEMKGKRDLLEEYRKTLDTVLGIEKKGIRSWATSVGYAITAGKLNRIGYDLGFKRWVDIRERNKDKKCE